MGIASACASPYPAREWEEAGSAYALLKRGTAEQWIKEGKQGGEDDPLILSLFPLRSSTAGVEPIGLQPGNLWRRLALSKRVENWSLTSLLPGW